MTYFTDRRVGIWFEFFARAAAVLIALTYAAGHYFGTQLHKLNDALAKRRAPQLDGIGPIRRHLKEDYIEVWSYAPLTLIDWIHGHA